MLAPRGLGLGLGVLMVIVSAGGGTSAATDRPHGPAGSGAQVELVAQTPVAAPGGTFELRLRLADLPPGGRLGAVVHERVGSRSELARSMDGQGLGAGVLAVDTPLSALAAEPDGTRRLDLALDGTGGAAPLRTEGVYPVEVTARDEAGASVATLFTHVIVAPEEGDDSPPLGVAVLAEIGAPPALQPDGSIRIERSALEDLEELVAGLRAASGVPATLAVVPETVDALAASTGDGGAGLVEALRAAARGREVLAQPYVTVAPDQLATVGLLSEMGPQILRGGQVLVEALGVEPVSTVATAPPELGDDGLAALAYIGVRRVVVSDAQVVPLGDGLISYSLAQPFLLGGPDDGPGPEDIQALATDPVVTDRLTDDGSPALVASRVLSELAFLRLEQPSVARSVVIPVGPGTPGAVVRLLLEGLDAGEPFAAMTLDDAFAHAIPLLDEQGTQVHRALVPAGSTPLRADAARAIGAARADLNSFVALLGADSPEADLVGAHLLLATAFEATPAERRDHLDAVERGIAAVTSQVSAPATFTLTLTAREGTIPLTIRNDSGRPLHVTITLRSQKLEFPEGEVIDRVLTEPSTRIDIAVRARASGAFPLVVDVTTPDGHRGLATTRYTVRSTAVSGAGLVLSVGAGLFLVVWWARHWRRTRRSTKLVA